MLDDYLLVTQDNEKCTAMIYSKTIQGAKAKKVTEAC